ncbi:UNVERIFIED_CONTAM: tRNA methyltransferase 2 [Siphonaria sp. JEL0065]|nr:tRNA methyltransferase 2 [Siphonaria sp. JEL0065]
MFGRTLLRTATALATPVAGVRSFSSLLGRSVTPFSAPTTSSSMFSIIKPNFQVNAAGIPVSPCGLMQLQQSRSVTFGQEYQPSVLKRKRKFGFLKRVRTVGGRKCLARRILKGRKLFTKMGLEEELEENEHEFLGEDADEQPQKKVKVDEAGTAVAAARTEPAPRFQIKLFGLDKFAAQKDLDKAIKAAGDELKGLVKSKKVYKMEVATLWFDSEENRANALSIVENFKFKKSGKLRAELVNHSEEPRDPREPRGDGNNDRKRSRDNAPEKEDNRTPQEKINDQVTPLWRKSYEEQIAMKSNRFANGLGILKKNLLGFLNKRDVAEDKKEDLRYLTKLKRGDRICPLEDVVHSPVIDDYRTKCEFTIGFDLDGNKAVGFLLGLYKEGVTTVLPPTDCKNVPSAAKFVAAKLQEFIQASELSVYDRVTKEGFWRLVQVRSHTTGDVMVIVQVNPLNVPADQKKAVLDSLSNMFKETKKVTTFLVQESSEKHNGFVESAPMTVLFGDGVIYEELLGLRFRISPTAFFQVNTEATNGLYGRVREWCSNPAPYPIDVEEGSAPAPEAAVVAAGAPKKNVVLLDLCCGTGTIGLTMASGVKKVIGVEMVAEAVEDAKFNANLQGCKNVTYICSKVEDAMREVFSKHVQPGDEVVAVLDPPRAGVHGAVIQAVRACKGINRVVFVSCDFEAAMSNFVDLCRPNSKKYLGKPFRPVRSVPFDLFPHTPHCEFVMELARLPEVGKKEEKKEETA